MAAKDTGAVGLGAMGAGTSGGTLLVLIANQFPTESFWHALLIYVAPSVTMIFGAAWIFLKARLFEVLEERNATIVIQKARSALREALDRHPSPEHERRLRENIEKLELIQFEKLAKRMEVNFEPDRG